MPIVSSAGFLIQVKSPWLVGEQDADLTIREEIHLNTQELMDIEIDTIRKRMPVDRGGAIADVWGIAYHAVDDRNLALIYSVDQGQQSAWGRTYIDYVEGGVLGRSTWTNAPREVYFQVTTTDIPQVEAWALKYVQQALDRLAAGTGVKS
jgi:hypothetical protein